MQLQHIIQYQQVDRIFLKAEEPRWELVHYQVVSDRDRGRPLLQYVLRRS